LVFAELVGPRERAGGGFWIGQGGGLGENGVGRMRMKRWWRLLWIVAASVLPAWPGHGVPVCPLPAAPTAACFGTDPLANGNPIGSGGDLFPNGPLDRLVSGDGGAVLLGCNGDGAWVKKTVGGTTTFYLVDDRNLTGYAEVVEEHQSVNGGAATLTAVYTHGLDLIAQQRSGSVRYFSYDGHGSTRLLTDTSGAVTDTYLYDAYGTLLTSTGSTPNNYLYCGEQFDPDLGMYSLRARYYQPQTGRFWTMDSWEGTQPDPLSLHKYLYAHNNPVNRIDPSGHFSLIEISIVGAINTTLRSIYELRTVAAKQAATAHIYEIHVGLKPVLPFGHSAIFIKNIITKRGSLYHIRKTDSGNWFRSQDGVLEKRPMSFAAFKTSFPVHMRLPTKMNFIQYQFWQQSIKFIETDDDDAFEHVPTTYSLLNFDIFLGQPYSCHSWTIKAAGLAFLYSKVGR